MPSLEKSVNSQFEAIFGFSDWHLFKAIAEMNLKQAARLKKKHMPITDSYRLIARNARKRLLIGVGVELLLKSIYLKHGYIINLPKKGFAPKVPVCAKNSNHKQLALDRTYSLAQLIERLQCVVILSNKDVTLKGLNIAKVFRNKEGHTVTKSHVFDRSNYSDIEKSLTLLYSDAFDETLEVRFSMARREDAVWQVARSANSFTNRTS